MNVCLIQSDPALRSANLSALDQVLEQLPADLYVLPELFTIGMAVLKQKWPTDPQQFPEGLLLRQVLTRLRGRGCAVIYGVLEQDGPRFYNAAAVIGDGWIERYRQKYPARIATGRVLPISAGSDCRKVMIGPHESVGLMVCHDYLAAEEFFLEFNQRGARSVVLIADSNTRKWLTEFPPLCQKYGVPAIVCNSSGTDKGGSCIFDRKGSLVPLRTAGGGVFEYLPEMPLAALGAVATSALPRSA